MVRKLNRINYIEVRHFIRIFKLQFLEIRYIFCFTFLPCILLLSKFFYYQVMNKRIALTFRHLMSTITDVPNR